MNKTNSIEYKDDYVQSANTLFHFMKRWEHLTLALDSSALMPRYCLEDIEYLDLKNASNNSINQIAVLQKCFCDIPMHKLNERFDITLLEGEITDEERRKFELGNYNTHMGCYGEFGIAFSKAWCTKKGLQPILYINKESEYFREFRKLFNWVMSSKDVDSVIAEDLLNRLAYLKPLQGGMERTMNGRTIRFKKNFHDEKEWRFIPPNDVLKQMNLERVIAKKAIQNNLKTINDNIELKTYEPIWLKFSYDDIKYIIVPSQLERKKLIEYILDLPSDKFSNEMMRGVFISKILVLDDIRKDW